MSWRDQLRGLRPRHLAGFARQVFVRDAGLKLFSLALAFALWFFVNAAERDTEAAFPVPLGLRDIPPNVMIVSPRVDFIDLRVSGPRALLGRIDAERLAVVLDLGGVRPGPAIFRIRPGAFDLPRGVNVVRMTPSEVTIEFARVVRKAVTVHLTIEGTPPPDLRVTSSKVKPELVHVIGPADEVERVKVAQTEPLDLSEAKSGLIERDLDLQVPAEYLSFSATLVHAQVLLEEPEETRTLENVRVVVRNGRHRTSLSPETVTIAVRGPKSMVESLELGHGAVYIEVGEREPGNYSLTPAVALPPEVELVEDPKKVRLEVSEEERQLESPVAPRSELAPEEQGGAEVSELEEQRRTNVNEGQEPD